MTRGKARQVALGDGIKVVWHRAAWHSTCPGFPIGAEQGQSRHSAAAAAFRCCTWRRSYNSAHGSKYLQRG